MTIKSFNKRTILGLVLFLAILVVGLGYYNSYIGYYGYDKHLKRRFSGTLSESKNRGVFIRNLDYHISSDSFQIKGAFLERGYRWGSSNRKTRELDTVDLSRPLQVVVWYDELQMNGKISVVSINKGDKKKSAPFYACANNECETDTFYFNILCVTPGHIGKVGTVKVWDEK